MIYRSNLTCPDLQPAFVHAVCREIPGVSHGHHVLSDWADRDGGNGFQIYKDCGFLTHDEAAILYHCCKRMLSSFSSADRPGQTPFLDIGAHTGWSSLHMAASGYVVAVEPLLGDRLWARRIDDNLKRGYQLLDSGVTPVSLFNGRSDELLYAAMQDRLTIRRYCGVLVDGDHGSPNPMMDAQIAHCVLSEDGFILFHDFRGGPVQDAVRWLSVRGYQVRMYFTPNMMACCYKGDFQPPDHVPDPKIAMVHAGFARDFPEWMPKETPVHA